MTLGAGSADGVEPGLVSHVHDGATYKADVRVQRVQERSSFATVTASTGAEITEGDQAFCESAASIALSPELQREVRNLASSDASTRWAAVDALSKSGDASAEPHLRAMLSDPDPFVRSASARALGEIGQRSSVPALLDAMSDTEALVREQACNAVRALSGCELEFDPNGSESTRRRQLLQWEDWREAVEMTGGF